MVMTLVVLTFVVFIALDYFVFSKRHAAETSTTRLEPLVAAQQQVPAGVFLQPSFTWSRLALSGEVYLGVHPMLLALVGAPCEFEFRGQGEFIAKGEPLVRVCRSGRHLTVRSPLAGRVEEVNRQASGETRWREFEGNDGAWLYRLRPERVADEDPTWFGGDRAAEWTRRQYDQLRTYLQGAVADRHLGAVMADGGELPVGILAELDEGVWAGLEERFLTHAE